MMTAAGRRALDELRIDEGLDPELPWGGRSPRSLIQADLDKRIESVNLRRETSTSVDNADQIIDDQYRRWLADARFHEGS